MSSPAVANSGGGNPQVRPFAEDAPAAPVMSRAEVFFCLREVHGYWSTPHISLREIEELERQNLIQRAPTGLCAIRLTQAGALFKQGRPPVPSETLKETYARTANARTLSS
jgi:hypothetical protein